MEASAIDSCLAGGMGVACRSPLGQWPSPPAAHTHHSSSAASSILSGGNLVSGGVGGVGGGSYLSYNSPLSDNENSDSMMSDCSPLNPGSAASSPTGPTACGSGNGNGKNGIGSRQNQVGTIMLHGVAIVSLVIDNKVSEDRERLCLAQISNTLLKDYSYNEIHNRRVALGITCVQCTPVQLEILRRAGAMPVSSRRCGMITKREAERLVKSFLEENTPPKLPEDFAFDVHHECGWGCRGFFEPSRYNSSRAKCIKCTYCNMYFSPNKFIFHFHRTPESKYNHPDAANFNSWRRHLKLYTGHDNEEIAYKWEDVKAMFNGGTRKRVFTSGSSPSSTASSMSSSSAPSSNHTSGSYSIRSQSRDTESGSTPKKAKTPSTMDTSQYIPKPPPFPNPFNPYNWLTTSAGKTPYPFMAMNPSQPMCFGFPATSAAANKEVLSDRMKPSPLQPPSWMGRTAATGPHFPLSSMDLFWDKAFGFPQAALGFRNSYPPGALPTAPVHSSGAPSMMNTPELHSPHGDLSTRRNSPHSLPQSHMKANYDRREKVRDRMSAFKRVVPSSPSSSSASPRLTPNEENEETVHNDYRRDNDEDDEDGSSICAQDLSTHKDVDDCEEIDVEEEGDERKRRSSDDMPEEAAVKSMQEPLLSSASSRLEASKETDNVDLYRSCHEGSHHCDNTEDKGEHQRDEPLSFKRPQSAASEESITKRKSPEVKEHGAQDSGLSDESDAEADNVKSYVEVTKDTFREDVSREKSFREHMAIQLEKLRETLTNELEQERKIRFSLQQKLKEAHDALQNFSCGLISERRDLYSLKDTAAIPR
uniref:c-SKI SMAD4-binding domain-containing protein n=1 Tax=Biomphalaria glabrata TaxID=6526 RepID=A0A2C9MA51_BIOGL